MGPLDALMTRPSTQAAIKVLPPEEQTLTFTPDSKENPRMCAGFSARAERYYRATTRDLYGCFDVMQLNNNFVLTGVTQNVAHA